MYQPVKSLGQNFLTDYTVVNRMLDYLGNIDACTTIEIGPGLGVLTEELVKRRGNIHSPIYTVEIDPRFVQKLIEMFVAEENLFVIEADILHWLPYFEVNGTIKILGSLPYYITSNIVHAIVEMKQLPSVAVLLVQKEVAKKISDMAPDSTYISALVQTFFNVDYLEEVSKKAFSPQPPVEGGVIKLTKREENYPTNFVVKYEGFLRKAFSRPRKMLNKIFKKEELAKGNIDPSLRAQNLNADQWLKFYMELKGNDDGK
jgi:16S rRNA (adenine1518-N6/adenine1519-N6)-dimethyltransferase